MKSNFSETSYLLHSWDIYSLFLKEISLASNKEDELKTLHSFKNLHRWEIDLESVLESPYEALVLTNRLKIIQWVSDGFEDMTGYSPTKVIGKKPKILQGKNTSKESIESINKQLYCKDTFVEEIVNYRKSGEEYICRVEIHALSNTDGVLTHFLALEREA